MKVCYPTKKTNDGPSVSATDAGRKKCWVTIVRSGYREFWDVPVDRVLRRLVEAARNGSDVTLHAAGPPPFVRDG